MSDDDVAEKIVDQLKPKASPSKVRDRNLNPRYENALEVSSSLIEVHSGRRKLGKDLEDTYHFTRYARSGDSRDIDSNDLLTTINPDTRLSNLGAPKDTSHELEYVRWAMDQHLTNQVLGLPKSAVKADMMRATMTETSLAKNGMLRKNLQTIRQESQHLQIEEPPKKQNLIQKFFSKGQG